MKRKNYYARKSRQLSYSVKQLKGLINNAPTNAQKRMGPLVKRIKSLVGELSPVMAFHRLKRIVIPVATFVGISFASQLDAQNFTAPLSNPFGLVPTGSFAASTFADLDGDGDLDLLVGGYIYDPTIEYNVGNLSYFENTGSATSPTFAPAINTPFGLTTTKALALPAFVDLDNDGDMDLLVGEFSYDEMMPLELGSVQYFENTGTPTSPAFAAPQQNPFGFVATENWISPTFVDLDNDGDMDLVAGEYYYDDATQEEIGNLRYYENIGTPSNPAFAAVQLNPFGLVPTVYWSFPTLADLDNDGDMDLLVGEYYYNETTEDARGFFQYYENTGTSTSPAFAAPLENPFGLIPTDYYGFPAFVDLDNDGDADLLVGEYEGAFQYFENDSPVGTSETISSMALELSPNPVHDFLTIKSDIEIDKIELFDTMGRLINTYYGSIAQINFSQLNKGMYLLKVIDREGKYKTKSVLKE